MQYSIYETITSNKHFPMNAFVVSMDSVAWHWHNEYEIIGVLSGSMTLRIQSRERHLNAGDLYLINAMELHSICKESEECICMIVQLSNELFQSGDKNDNEKIIYFYLDSTDQEPPECGFGLLYYRLAKITYETLRGNRVSEYRVRAQVCSLIADMMEFSVYDRRMKNRTALDQQNIVINIISYIDNNIVNKDIIEEACRKHAISRKTLNRMIDGMLSISAKELVDSLRIEKAKELLRLTDKSIGYIMDVCGYASEKTFYRSFKNSTGVTPKEYRDSIQIHRGKEELKGYLDYETPKVMTMLRAIIEKWENKNYHP